MNENDTHTRLPDHTVCIADELKRAHPDWITPQTWERCGCPQCAELLRQGREMFAPAPLHDRELSDDAARPMPVDEEESA